MTVAAADLRSGKGHKDENFPVASQLIAARHRPLIMAFYNFVRTADDVADHATLSPNEKLARLDQMGDELTGVGGGQPESLALRQALAECGMSPRHALDVLTAFRMDVTKLRYASWDELIHYCTYSAMPVGRFMLDVHGESTSTWAASDALCAALQINNHLQDCRDDYRNLDRVYIPQDAMNGAGVGVEMLGHDKSPPALLSLIHALAHRTEALLHESDAFARSIRDTRLACEVSVIQAYALRIVRMLQQRDPLADRVHLSKFELMALSVGGVVSGLMRRRVASAGAAQASHN